MADPHSVLDSRPDRRRFIRNAGLTFVGVSVPLPVLADNGPEQREAWQRVPADVAWRDFERNLDAVLSDLGVDEYLVLTVRRGSNRYVQFADEGRFGMLAETTSNRFRDPDDQLAAESQRRLIAMGWQAPNQTEDDASGPDGSPNFSVRTEWPVPAAGLADLAARTLREIHGVTHPSWLAYTAFTYRGGPIRFPSLRIARANG